jgi:hypothetical protein
MNKKAAEEQGLRFTGYWERSYKRESVKVKAADLRAKGYRAVLVEDQSGFSIYADTKYFEDQEIEMLDVTIENADARRAKARENYEQVMTEINDQTFKAINRKDEILKARK